MVAGPDRWLIRGATLVDAATDRLQGPLDVRLRDGRIAELRPCGLAATDGERTLDADGMLLIPGLVNAHFHSTGSFNRSFVDNLPLELFMLYELPPFDFGPFPGPLYRAQALWAAASMLKAGVTAVMDDAMFYPEPDEAAVDALVGAYRDAGIRATVGLYLPDRAEYEWLPGLEQALPEDVVRRMAGERPPADRLLDVQTGFAARWHGACDGRVRCALSCSAPQRSTDGYIRGLHAVSMARDLPLVFHVYESKLQRVSAQALYGTSMIRHLREIGVLDGRTVIVHAVWVDDADIADLADAGATVVHSPSGNLRCGSGVMPYRRLREAGVPVALCTDEATVEDRCNLWNVGRLAGMLQTIADPDHRSWPRAAEMLDAMTTAGARCLGLEGELGTVREGALADLVLLDRERVLDAPLARPTTALVYGEDGGSVRHVFVGGRRVVEDGRLTTIDEDELRRETRAWGEVWARAVEPVERWATRLAPVYERLYSRAAGTDVGVNRWLSSGLEGGV